MSVKVTVGIPAYNVRDTLKATVESVLRNTFTDYEIVIVDDGSTDDTLRVAGEIASSDSRIRVIHKENGGPGSARNVMLREAEGEYILFIDADDLVTDDYIETFVSVMDTHSLDWAVCAFFLGRITDGRVETDDYHHPAFPEDVIFRGEEIKSHVIPAVFYGPNYNNIPSMCGGIYRCSVIRDNRLSVREDNVFAEDMEFNFRFTHYIRSFAYLTKQMYYYLQYDDGITVRMKRKDETTGRLTHLAGLEQTRRELGHDYFTEYLIYASIQVFGIFKGLRDIGARRERRAEYDRFLREVDRLALTPLWKRINRQKKRLSITQRIFLRSIYYRWYFMTDRMRFRI